MNTALDQQGDDGENAAHAGLSLDQFQEWHSEIKAQPLWRKNADRECDYRDGNQLDSEVLRKQQAIGMPPAIEPLIGPVIDAVLGMEAQHRTDWRVIPDSDVNGDDVAAALNNKLNTAERQSKADKACGDAFAGQASVGIGWVEVSRDSNPFNFPYRAVSIPRNEIYWDWRAQAKHGTDDYRYLIRRKWTDKDQAKLLFPDKADVIEMAARGWSGYDSILTNDGGKSTNLSMGGGAFPSAYGAVTSPVPGDGGSTFPMLASSYTAERGSSLEEQEWRDINNNRVCLFEVWYRVWSRALVMKMPDGRVVEYDEQNEAHQMLAATGAATPDYAVISKVRVAWWLGPHRLTDEPSPYKHNKFPYVPFWGKREDRTGVPFGLIRGMMYLQDNVNATTSKIRWGLSAVRTIRTEGAALDDDDTLRGEVARPDADIVLDAVAMSKPGAVFKIERDFQLNPQQYQMLTDSRDGIKRVGGIENAFMGRASASDSGIKVANLAEQSTQSLADLMDNFRVARSEVGELLLSLVVEDMGNDPQDVTLKGGAINEDRTIKLNQPTHDPETGLQYLTNDVQRTMLKVTLEDVPHTPSFRSQQLQSFTEVFKSAPEDFQRVLFPQLLSLMDVPNKEDVIKAVKDASQVPTPQEIQQQIEQAVDQALTKAQVEAKGRELDIKQQLNDAQIDKIKAETVKTGVEAQFSSMQSAEVIASVPQVAPIADALMQAAGYQMPNPGGVDPNFPTGAPAPGIALNPIKNNRTGVQITPGGNTDPMSPANPAQAAPVGAVMPSPSAPATPGMGERRGIETMRPDSAPGFADGGMIGSDGSRGYNLSPTIISDSPVHDLLQGGQINDDLDNQGPLHSLLADSAFAQRSSSGVSRFSNGGQIHGPGSGTSDSIPAVVDGQKPIKVSSGEFVVPSDVVEKLGPEFFNELINKHHTPT